MSKWDKFKKNTYFNVWLAYGGIYDDNAWLTYIDGSNSDKPSLKYQATYQNITSLGISVAHHSTYILTPKASLILKKGIEWNPMYSTMSNAFQIWYTSGTSTSPNLFFKVKSIEGIDVWQRIIGQDTINYQTFRGAGLSNMLKIHLMPTLQLYNKKHKPTINVGLGGYIGLTISNYIKMKYLDMTTDQVVNLKVKPDIGLLRAGVTFTIGYKAVSLFMQGDVIRQRGTFPDFTQINGNPKYQERKFASSVINTTGIRIGF